MYLLTFLTFCQTIQTSNNPERTSHENIEEKRENTG